MCSYIFELLLAYILKLAKMCYYKKGFYSLAFSSLMLCLPLVVSECSRKPVIFNFGDSNSDTGGFAAVTGFTFGYPEGRAFFPIPTGRLTDGRLIIDFLCENLKTKYLIPYLESIEPDYRNGVNFAVGGAATLPKNVPFSLSIQILQFIRFHNRSLDLNSKGHQNLHGEEDFKNALYTIDIGQNDLTVAFGSLIPYDQVIAKIPTFISEIRDAMFAIYKLGGRNFWVHNTGPLGCLPEKLGTRKPNKSEVDQYGCISSMNEASKAFNSQLNSLCHELRLNMKDSTIVYVDVYSIKYNLIVNSSSYGFKNPLMACCGNGGPPYNFDPKNRCLGSNYTLCEKGVPFVSWDGVHYTEAANAIVASKILSNNYSTPTLGFNFFCNDA